jgi:thymidine phosphorylase
MDVKAGSGAFMPTYEGSKELAQSIVSVANGAGCKTTALITNMDEVLASSAGNAVEVREAVQYLTGEYVNPRLHAVTMDLCAEMLVLSKLSNSIADAKEILQNVLDNGKAADVFSNMVTALGGPSDFVQNYDKYLIKANIIRPVYAEQTGIVQSMDTRAIGMAVVSMGGGRRKPSDSIDYAVGFSEFVAIGEELNASKAIAMVHVQNEEQFNEAQKELRAAIVIGSKILEPKHMLFEKIRLEDV